MCCCFVEGGKHTHTHTHTHYNVYERWGTFMYRYMYIICVYRTVSTPSPPPSTQKSASAGARCVCEREWRGLFQPPSSSWALRGEWSSRGPCIGSWWRARLLERLRQRVTHLRSRQIITIQSAVKWWRRICRWSLVLGHPGPWVSVPPAGWLSVCCVSVYVCMYVCMYVHAYTYIYII